MPAFDDAIKAYSARELALTKFLVLGGNDAAAVSDGTMGCHEKDVHHLVPATRARRHFEDHRSLTPLVTMIKDCDKIVADSKKANYVVTGNEEPKLIYAATQLQDARAALDVVLDADYTAMAEACLSLRSGDVWVYTAFDKAVNVRARRQVANKAAKELDVQTYVIEDMERRFPETGTGYPAQLGQALRATKSVKNNLPIHHFAFGTLATIHKGFKDAAFTRFEIARTVLEKDGSGRTTMSLRKDYLLHFRHRDGQLVYADDLSARELAAMGTTYVMESKVYAGQQGDGFASADDEVWLDAVKRQPAVVLLSYLFSHNAYPEGANPGIDMMGLLAGMIDFKVKEDITREEADDGLQRFDFRGVANPALYLLAKMALFPRPDLGVGAVKYIDTRVDGFAYNEPTEAVGLNIHHIYSGTGEFAQERVDACNRRHQALGFPKLSTNLLVSGHNAVPINNYSNYRKLVEAQEDKTPLTELLPRIDASCDLSLFPEA